MSLRYILTYKLSQDHLELFFSAIRSRGGSNNNPNSMQFKNAYKKLLVNNKVKSIKGNCFPLDSTYILNTYNTKVDELNTKNHVDINIIKNMTLR